MFSTRRFCTSLISRVPQTYIGIFGQTKMYKQTFWMRALGHPTPKRTTLFSNSGWLSLFSFAVKMKKGDLYTTVATCDKYVSRSGKVRFKGNANLKSTQKLVLSLQPFVS